jgi:hypothetical protein
MREIELRIALDPADGDRLVGRLLSPHGEARPFNGWLGLISALDAELSPLGLDPPTPGTGSRAGTADVDESQREDSGGADE